jgi:hypothetical protein
MTLPRRRGSRPRGTARLALTGDFPDTDRNMPEALQRADYDGDTYWSGASDIGVMTIATFTHTGPAPLDGYQPAPATFPALQAAPEPRPVLAPVPVTERAVIGDELRLPIIWCEMPRCISWHRDPASAGERDARTRAHDAGWRTDALGRLACPDCQQTRADYRTPQPVTWHHPTVARHWHERGTVLREEEAFRLGVEAELGKRISYEDPALAGAIAGATYRHYQAVTP